MRRALFGLILSVTPRTRRGDNLISFISFLAAHKRLPTKNNLFGDFLYRMKTSDEILNPLRVFVSDKEFVKMFVRAAVGDQYNVPTLAVLRLPGEIKKFTFPDDCCIKPTHASGRVILRKDGAHIDYDEIARWFQVNYYDHWREANYKALVPKIIVEPLIFGSTNVNDFKFFCFNGRVKLIQVDIDRHVDHRRAYFTGEWVAQNFSMAYPQFKGEIAAPNNLGEMIFVAESLAKHFNFVRVDLYSNGVQCFVGEITNCHGNAIEKFIPRSSEIDISKIILE